MKLGMYSIELERPTVEELFQSVKSYGFSQMQFDFGSVCEEQMPERLDDSLLCRIRAAADANQIQIVSVNGTYNMIHPDPAVREEGTRRLEVIAKACKTLGCGIVTLCTGIRNADNMWKGHEDNQLPQAMEDLKKTVTEALASARKYDVVLGIECEPNNCIDSAEKAQELLEYFGWDSHLKIIMDVANLFPKGQAKKEHVRAYMDDAFERLGQQICLAHGKDILEGETLQYTYAGHGIVDFPYFIEKLDRAGYQGGMILHGIKSEEDFQKAVHFMCGL